MENIKQTLNGNILTLEIDISKRGQLSKTGKTIIVAKTTGNKRVTGTEVFFGLTAFTKEGV